MGERRNPLWIILLKKRGKPTVKVELFEGYLFNKYYEYVGMANNTRRFRIRVKGKWWPKGEIQFLTKTQIKELVFKGI